MDGTISRSTCTSSVFIFCEYVTCIRVVLNLKYQYNIFFSIYWRILPAHQASLLNFQTELDLPDVHTFELGRNYIGASQKPECFIQWFTLGPAPYCIGSLQKQTNVKSDPCCCIMRTGLCVYIISLTEVLNYLICHTGIFHEFKTFGHKFLFLCICIAFQCLRLGF